MFTGIVQGKFPLQSLQQEKGLLHAEIDMGSLSQDLNIGASVAIAGVCLTVVETRGACVRFDVIQETLDKTTLGGLRVGQLVNVERSARVGDEIGGHRVSGHVTGTVTVRERKESVNNCVLTFACDPSWMEHLLPKGFVALDGCSLTIVDVGSDWFTVHLIPETLRVTTFGERRVGDKINLEFDPETQAIVATVKRYLETKHL